MYDDDSSLTNATVDDPAQQCLHCGGEIRPGTAIEVGRAGSGTMVCSVRCADVVDAINTAGLNRFYSQRGGHRHLPIRLESDFLDHLEAYDDVGLQAQFVEHSSDGRPAGRHCPPICV